MTTDDKAKLIAKIATQLMVHGIRTSSYEISQTPVTQAEAIKMAYDIVSDAERIARITPEPVR